MSSCGFKRIYLKISPASSKNEITVCAASDLGISSYDESCCLFFKVKLISPPIENRANESLKKLISAYFNVSVSKIEIIKGLKSRYKTLIIKM